MSLSAERRLPPPEDGAANAGTPLAGRLACVAATPSVATATGVAVYGPGFYTFAVGAAFQISFSYDRNATTIDDPADDASFPAGVYEFWLDARNSHFKITANATAVCVYWKSSVGKN
jgi:hypothetical protein